MRTGVYLVVAWLVLAGLTGAAGAEEKRAIAVLDLKARGLEASVAENVTELVLKEIDRVGMFRTISTEEIKRMLEHEQQKILLGCDDTSCLAEIGGALGVDLLVAGGVGKLGDTWVISLKLIDVRGVKVLRREERTVSGAGGDLIGAARQAARTLLGPILRQESGMLELSCTEEEAEVYVDDVMVGTTPLEPRKLPGGFHALRITKPSFVAWARDVKIEPHQTARVRAVLVPSETFIKAYESRAGTYRTLAWTFTAVAVAAGGTASGLFIWNNGRLDDHEKDVEAFKQGTSSLSEGEINDQADAINMVDSFTLGITIGAVAAAGTALYFWLAGDPPGKYDGVESSGTASFELGGAPGSFGAGAVLRF